MKEPEVMYQVSFQPYTRLNELVTVEARIMIGNRQAAAFSIDTDPSENHQAVNNVLEHGLELFLATAREEWGRFLRDVAKEQKKAQELEQAVDRLSAPPADLQF